MNGFLPRKTWATRPSIRNAVSGYKLPLALTAVVFLLAAPSDAVRLGTIHLSGRIAADAEVGLAVSAPDTLYAAYWVEAGRGCPLQLLIYEFDLSTGKALARSELDKAQPLRSRNGDVIQSPVQLWLSPDRSVLLCTSVEGASTNKAWTLSSQNLRILSSGTIPPDANLLGFTKAGEVRLLRPHKGGKFGQEIDSATVLDLNAHSLEKVVSRCVIRLREPAWNPVMAGPNGLLWALDERASPQGTARITVYNLQNGKPVATYELPLVEAEVGVPAAGPRPKGTELPPPTGIALLGAPPDAPQLAQIMPTGQGILGVVDQSAMDWAAWSRIVRLGVASGQAAMSSVLTGCNLSLDAAGRSGRIAVGSCDLVGRVVFDQHAIKKSNAVFVSKRTGSVVAVVPLNTRRPPLSLAIDDSVRPAIAAIYDQHATVRLLSVPNPADRGAATVDPKSGNLHPAVPVPVSSKTWH